MTTESKEKIKAWKLIIGSHRGTLLSRGTQNVAKKFNSHEPLESLSDCIECARSWEANYTSMGCYLWFAHAIDPDGTKHPNIIRGTEYRR